LGEHRPYKAGVTGSSQSIDETADALPNPTAVTIAGADHFVFLEPDYRPRWSRAILDFLAR
jgi:pimeloyl-ACP methyl ester carboxylesterase